MVFHKKGLKPPMLTGMIVLLFFQLLGEWLSAYLSLPLPGPVVGLFLLLMFLIVRGKVDKNLLSASNNLFAYLPMLLIPATTGIYSWFPFILSSWLELSVVLIVSFLVSYLSALFLMTKFSGQR